MCSWVREGYIENCVSKSGFRAIFIIYYRHFIWIWYIIKDQLAFSTSFLYNGYFDVN